MKRPDLEQALGTHLETTCLDVSSASTGYKRETAGFSATHIRGGPAGPQKNPKPVARHSQGSVCKTATKSIYKQEFCPPYRVNTP